MRRETKEAILWGTLLLTIAIVMTWHIGRYFDPPDDFLSGRLW